MLSNPRLSDSPATRIVNDATEAVSLGWHRTVSRCLNLVARHRGIKGSWDTEVPITCAMLHGCLDCINAGNTVPVPDTQERIMHARPHLRPPPGLALRPVPGFFAAGLAAAPLGALSLLAREARSPSSSSMW